MLKDFFGDAKMMNVRKEEKYPIFKSPYLQTKGIEDPKSKFNKKLNKILTTKNDQIDNSSSSSSEEQDLAINSQHSKMNPLSNFDSNQSKNTSNNQ